MRLCALHLIEQQRVFRHDQEGDAQQARKVDQRTAAIAVPRGRGGIACQNEQRRQQQQREALLIIATEIERIDQRIADQHRRQKPGEQAHVHHACLAFTQHEPAFQHGVDKAPAHRLRRLLRLVVLLHDVPLA